MEYSYVRVLGVYRRENYIQLYLDRPNGFPIVPISLYELQYDDKSIILPIANGNNIKCLRFIIPRNKKTFWVDKLTERDMIKISKSPMISIGNFTPTDKDIFLAYGEGISHFTTYFSNPDYIVPNKLFYEVKHLTDCFELPLIGAVMKDNYKVYISGNILSFQAKAIKSNESLNKFVKLGAVINSLSVPTGSVVYVSGATKRTLNRLATKGISYIVLPTSLS